MAEFELRVTGALTEETAHLLRALFHIAPASAPTARVKDAPPPPSRPNRSRAAAVAGPRRHSPSSAKRGRPASRRAKSAPSSPRSASPCRTI